MSKGKVSCENFPPWYKQLIRLPEDKRRKAADMALAQIKEAKPEAYKFIKDFNCELIGFIPNVSYTMPDDSEDSLEVTFVHDFSKYTLAFWCEAGEFMFCINSTLSYNKNGLRGLIS